MRKTHSLVQVAVAFMADPGGRHWGYDLSKRSGVRSGVLYPTLQRMLDKDWVVDGWEEQGEIRAKETASTVLRTHGQGEGRTRRTAHRGTAAFASARWWGDSPNGQSDRPGHRMAHTGDGSRCVRVCPGAVLRLILLAFKRDDPRRTELLAELPHVPRMERPFWVFEQLEVALFEGLAGRLTEWIDSRRRGNKTKETDVNGLLPTLEGTGYLQGTQGRLGRASFKTLLLNAYHGRCAITGLRT